MSRNCLIGLVAVLAFAMPLGYAQGERQQDVRSAEPASTVSADSAASSATWHLLGKTDWARIEVEKALYEKAGEPFCFVRVRLTNVTDRAIGVDLRGWMTVLPGQLGKSETEHNNFFKQVRIYHAALDQPKRAELLADFAAAKLTVIPTGKSVDYYREYIERARVDKVDSSRSSPFGGPDEEAAADNRSDPQSSPPAGHRGPSRLCHSGLRRPAAAGGSL